MPWWLTALMVVAFIAILATAVTEPSQRFDDEDEDEGKWHG